MAPPLCPIRELKACSPTQLSSNGTWFAYFVARENADQERRRPPNFWRPKFSFGDTDGSRRCPLWVKSGHRSTSSQCLLYSQKGTSELTRGMSALCQKQTHAVQQKIAIRSPRRHEPAVTAEL